MRTEQEIKGAFDRATEKAQSEPHARKQWEAIMDALGCGLGRVRRRSNSNLGAKMKQQTGKAGRKRRHSCQDELVMSGVSTSMAKNGDLWTCPICELTYEHVCDEAEGCMWTLVLARKRKAVRP